MRICLSAIVILLGANLLIDLLDSDMMEVINERNETIQRQIDAMWGTKCHKLVGCLPIEEVSQGFGTDPQNRVSYRSGGEQDTRSSLLSESVGNSTAGDKLHTSQTLLSASHA